MHEFWINRCDNCGFQPVLGDEIPIKICPDCGEDVGQVLVSIEQDHVLSDNSSKRDVFNAFNDLGVEHDFWFYESEIEDFPDRWRVLANFHNSPNLKYVTIYKKSYLDLVTETIKEK